MYRKLIYLFTFVLVLGLATAANAAGPKDSNDPNLVAWYKLDSIAGSIAIDWSMYEHNGVITHPCSVPGMIGSGLEMYSSSRSVDCGTWNPSPDTNEFSVAIWIYCENPDGKQGIIAKRDAWDAEFAMWELSSEADEMSVTFKRPSGWGISDAYYSGIEIPRNRWAHMAATYDGESVLLYIDGVLMHEPWKEGDQKNNNTPWVDLGYGRDAHIVLGCSNLLPDGGGNEYFQGDIDDARIYNRVLNEGEVARLALVSHPNSLGPDPDGSVYVAYDTNLAWMAGWFMGDANSFIDPNLQELYLDIIEEDVNLGTNCLIDATPAANSYNPSDFNAGQTYYWRVDQTYPNDLNSPHKGDIWSFTIIPTKAYYPTPEDESTGHLTDAGLTWRPGNNAGVSPASHDVYVGSTFNDINDANRTNHAYNNVGPNSFNPTGLWGPGKKYFWRVDEVYAGPTTIEGDVWSFTAAPYVVLEDFESYANEAALDAVWKDWDDAGPTYYTGATVSLAKTVGQPYYHDKQSMKFDYSNSYYTKKWSETLRDIPSDINDWSATGLGIKALYLWFYSGHKYNAVDPLWVCLTDDSTTYQVMYPDANDVNNVGWHLWTIDLDDFNTLGLNFSDVKKIHLGTGERGVTGPKVGNPTAFALYFDDIFPYAGTCTPSVTKPAADFTDDCQVNMEDMRLMIGGGDTSGDWLKYSYTATATAPSDANLVIRYTFESQNLNDSSGNAHHAIARGPKQKSPPIGDPNYNLPEDPCYITGKIGSYALDMGEDWWNLDKERFEPNSVYFLDCGGGSIKDVPEVNNYKTWPYPHGDPNVWPNRSVVSKWPVEWRGADVNTWPLPKWPEELDGNNVNTWPDYDPCHPEDYNFFDPCVWPSTIYSFWNDVNWPNGWHPHYPNTWWDPCDPNTYWEQLEDGNDFWTWADYEFNSEITISCWVNPREYEKNNNKFVTKGNDGWTLVRIFTGEVRFEIGGNKGFRVGDPNPDVNDVNVPPDEWTHVAGTYDGERMCVYMDGILTDTKYISEGMKHHYPRVNVGGRDRNPWFTGRIDEVRVYNRGLSHGEIMNLAGYNVNDTIDVPLPIPEMDMYDDNEIDFKDYALMFENWFEDPWMWPTW